ncbi:hypothetical protein [Streptomyces sp. NPDC048242]|uniref:hypothetical protein n=1 Tax=Streptomyces sp. NPDC048242 TaxID=3155026 RepID=UPI00342A4DA4
MTLVLVPEYLLVVLLIGAFRGWMLPLTQDAVGHGMPTVVIAAILGTLFVIPTAGEIPIIQGLAVLGLPAGVLARACLSDQPESRGLARTSAALSSLADAPRRLPPPPCSCTHQPPLGSAGKLARLERPDPKDRPESPS